MYRQILVADEDQKYQQILWRNNSNENICTYKLKTVTYGLASASFLATRCIKQIALVNKDNSNLSRVLQEDIYMDDLLSGTDTPNNAISICKDIAHVLSTRGFHLRKWNSNSTEFLAQFSEHSSHDTRVEFSKDFNESSKVLGLFWNSSNAIQPEVRFIAKQNSLMKIGNNGNLVWGPFDESTPCLMIVLMNCQTKLRINHLTAVKSVAIFGSNANLNFYTWKKNTLYRHIYHLHISGCYSNSTNDITYILLLKKTVDSKIDRFDCLTDKISC
ncbi:uncharacterized protein TNCV_4251761 [Trichonephila clavipes]|nr:uncharacterized protein TNCV_4251761 [Trichonephila clavipes]